MLSFFTDAAIVPTVGMEVRELQTALSLVASGVGVSIVPVSVRRHGRSDIKYIDLNEPNVHSPIIMSYRKNDRSVLLATLMKQVAEITSPIAARVDRPATTK